MLSRYTSYTVLAYLICLLCCTGYTEAQTSIEPKKNSRRIKLHHLRDSQFERIFNLGNKSPIFSRAHRIDNPVKEERTLITDDLNSNFLNNNFMNLLRIIRFNTTDGSKRPEEANSPLCVIKVSDKEVDSGRSVADEANVKCVVVVKDKKADEQKRFSLQTGWDSSNWGSGAGLPTNVNYKPVYRPYYVPYPYHGHHNLGSHSRNVQSLHSRKQSSPEIIQPNKRKNTNIYYQQKEEPDAIVDIERQLPQKLEASQYSSYGPYDIYGALYNPEMFYNFYQSSVPIFASTFTPPNTKSSIAHFRNSNFQIVPPYLQNGDNIDKRSNKNVVSAADDSDDDDVEAEEY